MIISIFLHTTALIRQADDPPLVPSHAHGVNA
jgi:hypothetical protein